MGEKENGCYLKNLRHFDLIFHVHLLKAYMHMYARCEVSMIKPVPRRGGHFIRLDWLLGVYAK